MCESKATTKTGETVRCTLDGVHRVHANREFLPRSDGSGTWKTRYVWGEGAVAASAWRARAE